MRLLVLTMLTLGVLTAVPVRAEAPAAPVADVTQTLVAVEVEGSKFWLPGTVVAKKGQIGRASCRERVYVLV